MLVYLESEGGGGVQPYSPATGWEQYWSGLNLHPFLILEE